MKAKVFTAFIGALITNVDMNGSSTIVQLIEYSGVQIDTTSTNQQVNIPESPFVETMVLDNVVFEEGPGSTREMWFLIARLLVEV